MSLGDIWAFRRVKNKFWIFPFLKQKTKGKRKRSRIPFSIFFFVLTLPTSMMVFFFFFSLRPRPLQWVSWNTETIFVVVVISFFILNPNHKLKLHITLRQKLHDCHEWILKPYMNSKQHTFSLFMLEIIHRYGPKNRFPPLTRLVSRISAIMFSSWKTNIIIWVLASKPLRNTTFACNYKVNVEIFLVCRWNFFLFLFCIVWTQFFFLKFSLII